jgi:hypothetical protein
MTKKHYKIVRVKRKNDKKVIKPFCVLFFKRGRRRKAEKAEFFKRYFSKTSALSAFPRLPRSFFPLSRFFAFKNI